MEMHQYCLLFPSANEAEQTRLKRGIKTSGLREPITVYQGKILDGRNRYNALVELKQESNGEHYVEFQGTDKDALAFVLDKNLARRHLNTSQRSVLAARLVTTRQGQRTDLKQPSANLQNDQPLVSQDDAAKLLNVSTRSVSDASKVIKEAVPEVTEAIEKGVLTVSSASEVSKLAPEKQQEVASSTNPKKAAKEALQTTPSSDARASKKLPDPGVYFDTKAGKGRVWKVKGIVKFEIYEPGCGKKAFSIDESKIGAFLDAVTRCRGGSG